MGEAPFCYDVHSLGEIRCCDDATGMGFLQSFYLVVGFAPAAFSQEGSTIERVKYKIEVYNPEKGLKRVNKGVQLKVNVAQLNCSASIHACVH